MKCNICGKEEESLWEAIVPGTAKVLKLCKSCYWNWINMNFKKLLEKMEK